MVSKNSRMGNLVGIGVYHLQNLLSLPRESGGRQNHGGMQMVNTFSVWEFWTTFQEIPFSPEMFRLGRPK